MCDTPWSRASSKTHVDRPAHLGDEVVARFGGKDHNECHSRVSVFVFPIQDHCKSLEKSCYTILANRCYTCVTFVGEGQPCRHSRRVTEEYTAIQTSQCASPRFTPARPPARPPCATYTSTRPVPALEPKNPHMGVSRTATTALAPGTRYTRRQHPVSESSNAFA